MNSWRHIGLLGCLVASSGCQLPNDAGGELIQEQILDIVYIDTMSIEMSTVIFDSLATSGSGRLLVGYQSDELLGAIYSNAYFRLNVSSRTNDGESIDYPEKVAKFDYAEFELYYDDYSYYDTTALQQINLHILSAPLELDDDGDRYNLDHFEYECEPLGQLSFFPRPISKNKEVVPLGDETLAKEIFELSKVSTELLDGFDDLVNGFVLIADSTQSKSFLGFGSESRLLIHYTERGVEKEIGFSMDSYTHFNEIISNRSSTPFANLTTQKINLSSKATDNTGFLQGGIGLSLKVVFPGLIRLRDVLDPNFIFKASLELIPIKGSYTTNKKLPSELDLYKTDFLNRVQSGNYERTGSLSIDRQFDEETYYSFDVSEYLKYELGKEELTIEGLLITLPANDLNRSVNRLYLGNQSKEDYRAILKLYLLDYATN